MINEKAINRASERFGYFPNGFTSYRETLTSLSISIGYALDGSSDNSDDPEKRLTAYRDKNGSISLLDLAHEWAEEFEEKHKGHKWGEDDGPEWIEAIDMFFIEKCKTLEA